MERKIVHVIGTGTIGEPLIGLLCDYEDMGKVMGELKKNYSDSLDFSKAGSILKEILNK